MGDEPIVGVRRRPHIGIISETRQNGGLVTQFDIERVDHQNGRFFPRVVGAPGNRESDQVIAIDTKPAADRWGDRVGGMAKRQFQFGKAEHLSPIGIQGGRRYRLSCRRREGVSFRER